MNDENTKKELPVPETPADLPDVREELPAAPEKAEPEASGRRQRLGKLRAFLQDESVQQLGRILGAGIVQIGGDIAYDKLFSRYERPDYSVTPGLRTYERIASRLPRERFTFPSDQLDCAGYYYPAPSPKGLVAFAHGLHSGADDYLSIFEYLVSNGYSVIAFDGKGTYDSPGESTVGLSEALVELDHLLDFVKEQPALQALPLFTLGHSCGGFAASAVLSLHPEIRASAVMSAMNDANTMIVGKGFVYSSILGIPDTPMTAAFLEERQKSLFGAYTELNGVAAINGCACPVLIAHGIKDMVVEYPSPVSLISHKNELREENVFYYTGTGKCGSHDSIWRSPEAMDYQELVEDELKALKRKKGRSFSHEDEASFLSGINHDLYSAVNTTLFENILKIYEMA